MELTKILTESQNPLTETALKKASPTKDYGFGVLFANISVMPAKADMTSRDNDISKAQYQTRVRPRTDALRENGPKPVKKAVSKPNAGMKKPAAASDESVAYDESDVTAANAAKVSDDTDTDTTIDAANDTVDAKTDIDEKKETAKTADTDHTRADALAALPIDVTANMSVIPADLGIPTVQNAVTPISAEQNALAVGTAELAAQNAASPNEDEAVADLVNAYMAAQNAQASEETAPVAQTLTTADEQPVQAVFTAATATNASIATLAAVRKDAPEVQAQNRQQTTDDAETAPTFDDTAVFLRADGAQAMETPVRAAEGSAFGSGGEQTFAQADTEDGQGFAAANGAIPAPAFANLEAARSAFRSEAARNVNRAEVISQIMDKFKTDVSSKVSEVKISLRPENLGDVTLKVVTENGIVTAQFLAENHRVKEIIEGSFDRLKESLVRQGLQVSQLTVAVDPDAQSDKMNRFHREQAGNAGRGARVISAVSGGAAAGLPVEDEIHAVEDGMGAELDFFA